MTTEAPAPGPASAWRWLGWTVASLLGVAALLLGGALWLATSAPGTAWLVGHVPGITVTAPQGSLIGDFGAERVVVTLAADERIVIDGLRWHDLTLARPAAVQAWLRIEAASVRADRVEVHTASGSGQGEPATLRLPIEIAIAAVDVAELHASSLGEQPVRDLHLRLEIGADAGRLHRIDELALRYDRVSARGAMQVASRRPFETQASLTLASRADATAPFDATFSAHGPLARLALQGTLRGQPAQGRAQAEPPSLDAQATLAPFAAWPIADLELRTHALDLAALHSGAPATALSGTASLSMDGADQPAKVSIALANAMAGRIDEGRLPLRSVTAELRARPDDPARGDIQALDIALGTADAPAGRVQGSGHWTPEQVQFDARLADLAAQLLDARAPTLRVSGQAALELDRGSAGAPATAPSATLRGSFSGSLPVDGRQQQVALELDASASAQHVELRKALLHAAGSSASLQGRAAYEAARRGWQIDAKGALTGFDPSLWWPGPQGSAWRKGPHRLNGTLTATGLLPHAAAGLSLQQIALAQGQAALRIDGDSELGGVPVSGDLSLRGHGSAGAELAGSLAVAGSSVALRGRIAPDGADHWELETHGADLSHWSALAALAAAPGAVGPALTGSLDADVAADGRWPHLATHGTLKVDQARVAGGVHLAHASLRWTASSAAPQAPLSVQADVEKLVWAEQRIDKLRLRVEGTAADHTITLDGASPVRPPRWIDLLRGADTPPGSGTRAAVRARGALQLDPAGVLPLHWQGKLQQFDLYRGADSGAAQPAWFSVAESTLDLQYDASTRTPRVVLGPGRAALPNLALRWSEMRWQGGPAGAGQLALQADIEPFAVAPLLARLQPDFGWKGDLVVAGHVDVHSSPTFVAEVEFGRQHGDLSVTDENGERALELTDLRLGLDARDGVWNFTQALAGKSLGALAGAATVRTGAKALWPPADAPLEGVAELRIADLAAWGAWAPPGWRLQGKVHATASFGGSFGAPEYTGKIDGSGIGVRNLVEGVDVRDGELDVALEGETAQIRKLQAHAGDGNVNVTGAAHFGATPRLDVQIVADKMQLLGRVDRRIVVSGNARLGLEPDKLELGGRFTIDQGLIDISRGTAPELGDDVTVVRAPAADAAGEAQASVKRAVRSVDVNVYVDLGRDLRLRGRGLDTRLEGDLTFTAPDGRLALNGVVRATQGSYAAYNQKLQIERGAITFSGVLDNPRLDILAVRPNIDVKVGVAITGTARQPRVSLYSDPEMSDNAKLSWLVLGRAPEESNRGDTALLQAAAMAILSGEGDTTAARLARLNPLDTLSVHQASGDVHDTVLTVGKQLSQRWYIGYERTLSKTAGNWQLIYRLAQRFTIRLQTGVDNSIDLIWSWRWD